MSLASLVRRITEFGYLLIERGFALDARAHRLLTLSKDEAAIIWSKSGGQGMMISNPARLKDYIDLIDTKNYSYLMMDGAIIQMSFLFTKEKIAGHRLLYYPCPFELDNELINETGSSIVDFIKEVCLPSIEKDIILKSPIRFDYAPEAAKDYHPSSHVTINNSDCRIPVRAPMRFDQFIRFILENFYPVTVSEGKVFGAILGGRDEECLSEHDRSRLHLSWRSS
jgi:hypothetical protein